jgi:hypothetical protein
MKNKPNPRNWDDVKMVITTGAITLTLVFWNLFSKTDNQLAAAKVTKVSEVPPASTASPIQVVPTATPVVPVISWQATPTVVPTVIIPVQANTKNAPQAKAQKAKPAGKTGSSQ